MYILRHRKFIIIVHLTQDRMQTGIGLLIEVDDMIHREARGYPASHRYEGVILTPAGEKLEFVTDSSIPESPSRAIARPREGYIVVADFIR